MLSNFYLWFWFHTEFWLTLKNRRPYTFIMRDWVYTHTQTFLALVVLFYAGMMALAVWHGIAATISGSLCSLLLAHLVWGTKWIEGEQEVPEYMGEAVP